MGAKAGVKNGGTVGRAFPGRACRRRSWCLAKRHGGGGGEGGGGEVDVS